MTCKGCDKAFSLPDKHLLALQFTNHEKVCQGLTNSTSKPDGKDNFVFAKLVHEHELNKMELETKCGKMSPVNWRQFSERWAAWKKMQPPGQELTTSLLGLVPLARNKITNEINGDYSEDRIRRQWKSC